jgi:hypothetical protein
MSEEESKEERGLLKRAPESYTRRVGKSRSIEKCREVSRGVYCTSPTWLGTKVTEPAVGLPNVVV